jgi:hypothetical protein
MPRLPEVPDLRGYKDEVIAYALCALPPERLYSVFERTAELYRSGEGPAAIRRAEERAARRDRRQDERDDRTIDAIATLLDAFLRPRRR